MGLWLKLATYLIALNFCMAESSIEESNENELSLRKPTGRLFSFNKHGDEEVKMDIEFTVPFIHIPVGSKKGSGIHPIADINTKSIVTVGTMLFVFIFILPKLIQIFMPEAYGTSMNTLLPIMSRVDEALRDKDGPIPHGCYEKVICWSVKKAKPISHFISDSNWVKTTLNPESLTNAVLMGQHGEDCNAYQCNLSVASLAKVLAYMKGSI